MAEFFVYVQGSKIINTALVRQQFTLKDGRYKVTILKANKRTLPSNNYYWGCIVPLVKHGLIDAGFDEINSDDDAHAILKHLFLQKKYTNPTTGELIEVTGSTADLSTIEFNEYIEKIYKWAATYLSIVIPPPNTQVEMFPTI